MLILSACLRFTVYDTEPERVGLVAANVEQLAAQGNPGERFRFVAMADTHGDYEHLRSAVRRINAQGGITFGLHAGDLTAYGLLDEYDWAWDELERTTVPVLVTIGNHDALSFGPEIWSQMFGPFDYSFLIGNLKVVVFNSNILEFPTSAPNRAWVRSQIENGADRSVVVLTHHPPQGADDVPGGTVNEFYAELLQLGKLSLWIHGHQAEPRLYQIGDTTVLQCGTFGAGGRYWTVDVAPEGLSFEHCDALGCHPREPEAR